MQKSKNSLTKTQKISQWAVEAKISARDRKQFTLITHEITKLRPSRGVS